MNLANTSKKVIDGISLWKLSPDRAPIPQSLNG